MPVSPHRKAGRPASAAPPSVVFAMPFKIEELEMTANGDEFVARARALVVDDRGESLTPEGVLPSEYLRGDNSDSEQEQQERQEESRFESLDDSVRLYLKEIA